jgi:hypothetical protein
MPATVIAERIGWHRGITVLEVQVVELRRGYLPPDGARSCLRMTQVRDRARPLPPSGFEAWIGDFSGSVGDQPAIDHDRHLDGEPPPPAADAAVRAARRSRGERIGAGLR